AELVRSKRFLITDGFILHPVKLVMLNISCNAFVFQPLIDHLSHHIQSFKQKPSNITADAGYGSEQNYQWLEDKGITAYVKHNQFDRMQNETIRNKKPFASNQLSYNPVKDEYTCPSGKPMKHLYQTQRPTKAGYMQTIDAYRAVKCKGGVH
ncbi:MAG: transposase, partial [Flammeovirgaceae bacterium]